MNTIILHNKNNLFVEMRYENKFIGTMSMKSLYEFYPEIWAQLTVNKIAKIQLIEVKNEEQE